MIGVQGWGNRIGRLGIGPLISGRKQSVRREKWSCLNEADRNLIFRDGTSNLYLLSIRITRSNFQTFSPVFGQHFAMLSLLFKYNSYKHSCFCSFLFDYLSAFSRAKTTKNNNRLLWMRIFSSAVCYLSQIITCFRPPALLYGHSFCRLKLFVFVFWVCLTRR